MKYLTILSLTCIITLIGSASLLKAESIARDTSFPKTYFFEGDEIVFEFDVRMYKEATLSGTREKIDFEDLDIYQVAVAGEFNDWSQKDWKMEKVGHYTYQLRKKVDDFEDSFSWQFKYVVNGAYWAEPPRYLPNTVKIHDYLFWEDIYNLKLYTIREAADGNAHFYLEGFPEADRVILSGTFNGWNEGYPEMKRVEDGWALTLDLEPGIYEYKFIVDGEWHHDPANPESIENEHGTLNSVFRIKKEVAFYLNGYTDASSVTIAGTFNDWDIKADPMKRTPNGWQVSLKLDSGKHHYKFYVDGKWIEDPDNPITEYDLDGNLNSVMMVR